MRIENLNAPDKGTNPGGTPHRPRRDQDDQRAMWERNGEWLNAGFTRINEMLEETGLVTRLHGAFTDRGIEDFGYSVFDAVESHMGFPMPVRTRYVVPTGFPVDTQERLMASERYPGLVVSEVLGLGIRTLAIEVGLDRNQLAKIGARGRAIMKQDPNWRRRPQPDWWTHSGRAVDLTEPTDLDGDIKKSAVHLQQGGEHIDTAYNSFIFGGSGLIFESEDLKNGVEREWEDNTTEVDQAFHKLEETLDKAK